MRIRIDPRHEHSARRLRDLYIEEAVVRAVVGLDRAIRRAAERVASFASGLGRKSAVRRAPCRS